MTLVNIILLPDHATQIIPSKLNMFPLKQMQTNEIKIQRITKNLFYTKRA